MREVVEMAEAEVTVKISLVALFYEKGKSGNDVLYKEKYKVPIPVSRFKSLKDFLQFVR